jgi:hypothetical protein
MTKTQNLEELLNQRFNAETNHTKVKALAKHSNDGTRSSFGGLFRASELSLLDKTALEELLKKFAHSQDEAIDKDFEELSLITSEVRAINNQAAILHGERIQRAQRILKRYRDGAFSAWLVSTYGNRQTPYNFLLYFEFLTKLPLELKPKAEWMPRQAVYTLASRTGSFEEKKAVVESYNGETKQQLLNLIRESFPLDSKDKRKTKVGQKIVQELESLLQLYKKEHELVSTQEKKQISLVLGLFIKTV